MNMEAHLTHVCGIISVLLTTFCKKKSQNKKIGK